MQISEGGLKELHLARCWMIEWDLSSMEDIQTIFFLIYFLTYVGLFLHYFVIFYVFFFLFHSQPSTTGPDKKKKKTVLKI